MNCPKCGREIPNGSKFCQFCGEKLQSPVENTETKVEEKTKTLSKKAKGWIIAGASVLLLIVLYIGTYLISWHSAVSYNFTKASKWLVLPGLTEIYDSGFPEYVNAGLLYEKGYFDEAKKTFRDYYIDDEEQLTLKERFTKAVNQVTYGAYDDALTTIKPLVEQNYKDAFILQEEAKSLKALELAKDNKFVLALDMLDELKRDKYPLAEDYYDGVVKNAYSYAVDLYHDGNFKESQDIFNKILDYKDAKKYHILTCYRNAVGFTTDYQVVYNLVKQYSYEDLFNLIGFEDTSDVIFSDYRSAERFMEGTFAGSGYSIKTWKNGDNGYQANWSIPGIPSGNWSYKGGEFYTGDVARMKIDALTKDSIEITVYSNNKTYTLTRQ